jgi:hypothetical protein
LTGKGIILNREEIQDFTLARILNDNHLEMRFSQA